MLLLQCNKWSVYFLWNINWGKKGKGEKWKNRVLFLNISFDLQSVCALIIYVLVASIEVDNDQCLQGNNSIDNFVIN